MSAGVPCPRPSSVSADGAGLDLMDVRGAVFGALEPAARHGGSVGPGPDSRVERPRRRPRADHHHSRSGDLPDRPATRHRHRPDGPGRHRARRVEPVRGQRRCCFRGSSIDRTARGPSASPSRCWTSSSPTVTSLLFFRGASADRPTLGLACTRLRLPHRLRLLLRRAFQHRRLVRHPRVGHRHRLDRWLCLDRARRVLAPAVRRRRRRIGHARPRRSPAPPSCSRCSWWRPCSASST